MKKVTMTKENGKDSLDSNAVLQAQPLDHLIRASSIHILKSVPSPLGSTGALTAFPTSFI